MAPVSINVVGEDGYWTLPSRPVAITPTNDGTSTVQQVPAPPAPKVYALPPLPRRMIIGAGLIGVLVLGHLVVLYLIRRELGRNTDTHPFLELPFVRVLAPPQADEMAARYHRLAFTICFVLLAFLAAWTVAVALPLLSSGGLASFLVPYLSALVFGGIVVASIKLYGPSTPPVASRTVRADDATNLTRIPRPQPSVGAFTGWLLLGGMIVTMGLFAAVTILLIRESTGGRGGSVVLARVVGGGIVSPAAVTVSLIAALYTVVFMGIRRLSLVGRGYKQLSERSRTFALLTGAAPAAKGTPAKESSLAAMLDMPAQNLPAIYPLVVLLALTIAWIGAWNVSTIEGRMFSWFVRIGSLTALGLGLLLLAQGLATWTAARSHLKRLEQSPLEPHFKEIASHVPWEISLAPRG